MQPSESTTDQSKATQSETAVPSVTASVQETEPEMSMNGETESNEVPTESFKEASNTPDPEPEKLEKQKTKLEDILSWLHNEPPLTEEQLGMLSIEDGDFEIALKSVQPSAKREGFATVPDVTWNDIGSLQDIRQELQMTIMVKYKSQRLN